MPHGPRRPGPGRSWERAPRPWRSSCGSPPPPSKGTHSSSRCSRLPKSRPPTGPAATAGAGAERAARRVADTGRNGRVRRARQEQAALLVPARRQGIPALRRRERPQLASAHGLRSADRRRRPRRGRPRRWHAAAVPPAPSRNRRARRRRAGAGSRAGPGPVSRPRTAGAAPRPGPSSPPRVTRRPNRAAGSPRETRPRSVPAPRAGPSRRPRAPRPRCRRAPRSALRGPWPCGSRARGPSPGSPGPGRGQVRLLARVGGAILEQSREAAQREHAERPRLARQRRDLLEVGDLSLAAPRPGERGQDPRLLVEPLEHGRDARAACASGAAPRSRAEGRGERRAAGPLAVGRGAQRTAEQRSSRRCRGR